MNDDTIERFQTLITKNGILRCECCHGDYATCSYVVRLGYKRLHADLKIHEKSGSFRVWVCEKCAAIIEHERSIQTWVSFTAFLVTFGGIFGITALQRGFGEFSLGVLISLFILSGLVAFLFWFFLRPKKMIGKSESVQSAYSEHWFFRGIDRA